MLGLFLQESSIHGLRYLVQAKHWLAKIIWIVCIAGCLTSACTIIYFNVLNWNNSPAVVTSVDLTWVKDKVPFPMITICPNQFNHNGLFFNLINENMDLIEDSFVEELEETLISYKIWSLFERRLPEYSWMYTFTKKIFKTCEDETMVDTPECKFAFLLSEIARAIRTENYYHQTIKDYLLGITLTESRPNLHSLQLFVENRHNISLWGNLTQLATPADTLWMQQAYAYFFPLFNNGHYKDAVELQPIDNYKINMKYRLRKQDMASLLSFLNDRRAMQDYKALSIFLTKITLYIIHQHMQENTFDDAIELINYFTYNPGEKERHLFPSYDRHWQLVMPCGKDDGTFDQICKNNQTETCQDYCKTVRKGRGKINTVIDIFKQASYGHGKPEFGKADELLPTCKQSEGDLTYNGCWTEVTTDRGICFASHFGEKPPLIPGTGEDQAFQFTLDRGYLYKPGDFYKHHIITPQTYDLIVTPPGHYSIGKLARKDMVTRTYRDEDASTHIWQIKVAIDHSITTSPEFRGMSPDKRDCYYFDEVRLQHFPVYSQPNCVLECVWEFAKEECACVPWFLVEMYPSAQVCETYGNLCFKKLVDERYKLDHLDCGCLSECDKDNYRVIFDTLTLHKPFLNTEEEKRASLDFDYLYNTKINNANPEVLNITKSLKSNVHVTNVGQINFFVEQATTLQVTMTATITIIDMISNIGGTLGLFCGFSILSGVEFFYWMGKWATGKK